MPYAADECCFEDTDLCGPCPDFDYRCVIVDTPSPVNETLVLPESIKVVACEELYVEFWATDSGGVNTGIVSAYVDLDYPEDCVVAGPIEHTGLFRLFPSDNDTGSVIDELGGSQLSSGVGVEPEWARVAYVEFTGVENCGYTEFQLAPATWESSAYGRGAIPTSEIAYGSCRFACPELLPIPTVSEWGLIVMAALLAGGGAFIFAKYPRAMTRRR